MQTKSTHQQIELKEFVKLQSGLLQ